MKVCPNYYRGHINEPYEWKKFANKRIPRKIVKCEECGRKILQKIVIYGGEAVYAMPPHRPKGWWKKQKKISKQTKIKRR